MLFMVSARQKIEVPSERGPYTNIQTASSLDCMGLSTDLRECSDNDMSAADPRENDDDEGGQPRFQRNG